MDRQKILYYLSNHLEEIYSPNFFYFSSLGLAVPPRIRFLQKEQKRIAEKEDANKVRSSTKETSFKTQQSESADSSDEESDDDEQEEEEEKKTEVDDKKESGLLNFGLQDEDGDELFTVKSKSSETHVSSSSEVCIIYSY